MLMFYQEIQEATASKPLNLDEEYAMQQSWREDPDKLTFIICYPGENLGQTTAVTAGTYDSANAMMGDVNMFISLSEDSTRHEPLVIGELELMIAEKAHQRKGSGRAALLSFVMYVLHNEVAILRQFWRDRDGQSPPSRFAYVAAKIGKENGRSLALFESLGFKRTSEEPNYWGEYELRNDKLTRQAIELLMARHGVHHYSEVEYKN
jgi:RimJ/RimL family protein N-acetyltransferase